MGGFESDFSVLLWAKPKALVYALAQAEQKLEILEDDLKNENTPKMKIIQKRRRQ